MNVKKTLASAFALTAFMLSAKGRRISAAWTPTNARTKSVVIRLDF